MESRRKKKEPDGGKRNRNGDPAKKSARRADHRRTDQWEHLRKGLFRYKDTARQADLQATRR